MFSPEEWVGSREEQTSIWFEKLIPDRNVVRSDSSAVIYHGYWAMMESFFLIIDSPFGTCFIGPYMWKQEQGCFNNVLSGPNELSFTGMDLYFKVAVVPVTLELVRNSLECQFVNIRSVQAEAILLKFSSPPWNSENIN